MPHVTVKCFPGPTEEQKQRLADEISRSVAEIFGSRPAAISVAVEEVAQDRWKAEVYDTEIAPRPERLYTKPGYTL